MEILRQIEESDTDNEEIFFGPLTKREVISNLKHYNLCSDELLEPLQKFQDSDVLDDSVIKFYYEDVFPQGRNNVKSRCSKSFANVSIDKNVQDSSNNVESTSTRLYRDSLDLSDSTSVLKIIESVNDLDQMDHDSLTIQYLNLDENEPISLNSTSEKSASISLNSTQENSKLKFSPDLYKTSISLNSTPEKSECSYGNTNDNSDFNCTLEEMEMLMKFGENYINENKDPSISRKCADEKSQNEYEKENYSPNDSIENELESRNTENKNKLIHRQSEKGHCYESPSPSPFKLPRRISKKSPNFRNIVSPIAMYIKSTPKVPLVQNVSKKTVHASTFKEVDRDSHQLSPAGASAQAPATATLPILPVRSYQPATRTMLLSDEPEPAMPASLRRLVRGPLLPKVIRHVRRVPDADAPQPQPSRMPDQDQNLTILSSSDSSAMKGDVSVHISRNATRTNRLQHT